MKVLRTQLIGILIGVLLLSGCPWLQRGEDPLYTSANLNANYRRTAGDMLVAGMEPEYTEDVSGDAERELVEPDVIRRSGNLLYVLNQYRGLTIVDLNTEVVLSQTPTYGHPRDLYLDGNRAYVLVSYARHLQADSGIVSVSYDSNLYVLNVGNPLDVTLEGSFSFDGDLVDSRLVGNVIYAVWSAYTYYDEVVDDGYTAETEKSYGTTGAISINIADPDNIYQVDSASFDGYGNLIQATNYAIFVAGNDYQSDASIITYVDISDPEGQIVLRGNAAAPGYMADRFKMDAWNGALRVVTNTGWPELQTWVTLFDITNPDSLTLLGQTTLASASGETLYATRFDGPLAYVVTYFTVDPLFVLDLSDPAAPVVAGELKIPGWSTHIEPRGDRLIALGVDDQDGRRVMVSLFDVSNPSAPQRLDYASFGDGWSWSSAYSDVKALTVLDDLILVPFSGWNEGSGAGYDRLQFVAYNRENLEVQGSVDIQGSVVRSFEYADRFYAVTQEELAVIDAGDAQNPVMENTLTLAENVTDVLPLQEGWVIEVSTRYNVGDTLLRAKQYATGSDSGVIRIPTANQCTIFPWNTLVAVVSPVYRYEPEYQAYYQVWLIDFSDTAAPVVAREWTADIEPWWGGWWWGGGGVIAMDDAVAAETVADTAKMMPYYPYYRYKESTAFLAGDYLILRGMRTGRDWWLLGAADSRDTLAVIDLADANAPRYVDLGGETIHSISTADNLVYITSYEAVTPENDAYPYCAYYLQSLNPWNLERGAKINVPGVFMHQVPETNTIVLEDIQYKETGETYTVLRSAAVSGDSATLLDSLEFSAGSWEYKAAGSDIFVAGMPYANGPYYYADAPGVESGSGAATVGTGTDTPYYTAGLYTLTSEGVFESPDRCSVSESWCSLLGVLGRQLYVAIAGAGVAHYDFTQSPPALAALMPTMSSPYDIRFDASTAYIPLGYSGVLVLE